MEIKLGGGFLDLLERDDDPSNLSSGEDCKREEALDAREDESFHATSNGIKNLRKKYLDSCSALYGEDVTMEYANVVVFDNELPSLEADILNKGSAEEFGDEKNVSSESDDDLNAFDLESAIHFKSEECPQDGDNTSKLDNCAQEKKITQAPPLKLSNDGVAVYNKDFVKKLRIQKIIEHNDQNTPFKTRENKNGDVVVDMNFNSKSLKKLFSLKSHFCTERNKRTKGNNFQDILTIVDKKIKNWTGNNAFKKSPKRIRDLKSKGRFTRKKPVCPEAKSTENFLKDSESALMADPCELRRRTHLNSVIERLERRLNEASTENAKTYTHTREFWEDSLSREDESSFSAYKTSKKSRKNKLFEIGVNSPLKEGPSSGGNASLRLFCDGNSPMKVKAVGSGCRICAREQEASIHGSEEEGENKNTFTSEIPDKIDEFGDDERESCLHFQGQSSALGFKTSLDMTNMCENLKNYDQNPTKLIKKDADNHPDVQWSMVVPNGGAKDSIPDNVVTNCEQPSSGRNKEVPTDGRPNKKNLDNDDETCDANCGLTFSKNVEPRNGICERDVDETAIKSRSLATINNGENFAKAVQTVPTRKSARKRKEIDYSAVIKAYDEGIESENYIPFREPALKKMRKNSSNCASKYKSKPFQKELENSMDFEVRFHAEKLSNDDKKSVFFVESGVGGCARCRVYVKVIDGVPVI